MVRPPFLEFPWRIFGHRRSDCAAQPVDADAMRARVFT